MSEWIGLPENTDNIFGMVYIIKNNINGKKYIGCKQLLKKTRLKANKTRKRDKIVWKDNNVEEYWGSSKELLIDIDKYGVENFTKHVIELCNSKFHMKYSELCWQIKFNALFDPNFYNGIINVRLGRFPKDYIDIERNPDTIEI